MHSQALDNVRRQATFNSTPDNPTEEHKKFFIGEQVISFGMGQRRGFPSIVSSRLVLTWQTLKPCPAFFRSAAIHPRVIESDTQWIADLCSPFEHPPVCATGYAGGLAPPP